MKNKAGVSSSVRLLIADSSRIHTQLLSDILRRDSDFELITWDQNRSTLVPTVIADAVDVLAVSSTLNGRLREGLEVIREVRAVHPTTKAVLLVDSHQDDLVLDSLRAGAKAIFSKDSSLEMLRKCLLSVHRGEVWVDGKGMLLALNALTTIPSARDDDIFGPPTGNEARQNKFVLSPRELEFVSAVVAGYSNKEIAEYFKISENTVKNYLLRLFGKLGVSNRVELLYRWFDSPEDGDTAGIAVKKPKPPNLNSGSAAASLDE